MPGIDNWAHAGGFAGGYLTALVLDPLKPEKIDHLLAAVIAIGVSLLAVVYTFLYTLP
jgi:membrane associated rhomboid family serine protease